jgi:anaerobic dimethyl sulfoxide reductase subunit B (iron-sulfur subunit)
MTQYGFYFDGQRCTGCKTCELACKDYKDLSPDYSFRNIFEYTGGAWTANGSLWNQDVFSYSLSIACNHCDSPACLVNCPAGAISKDSDTGIVTIDPNVCVGNGSCVKACPYHAPKFDKKQGKARKCDLCADRVAAGNLPICVQACPLRALDFGDIDDLRAKYGADAAIAPLPEQSETEPNLVIKPSPNAKPVGDTIGGIANSKELGI